MSEHVNCDCGQWSGIRCQWSGPEADTVIVEYMPEYRRTSHEAAGNTGQFPANDAERIRVEKSCADIILEHDGEWARIVDGGLARSQNPDTGTRPPGYPGTLKQWQAQLEQERRTSVAILSRLSSSRHRARYVHAGVDDDPARFFEES